MDAAQPDPVPSDPFAPEALAALDGPLDEVLDDLPVEPGPWTWAQRALLAAFITLVVVANVGSVVAPHLQKSSPALLLAMSSRNRHLLVVVANHISPWSYGLVAFGRLLLAAMVCYGLGRVFGSRALRWFTRYLGVPKMTIDRLEEGFETISWVLVPIMAGSNIVCLLAGLRPLPVKRFVALVSVGIAGRLVLFWVLAEHLRKPLDWFVRQTTRFQFPLMGVLLAWVVFTNARHLRRPAK
jgi:membrane protein DedA with SNARE-associated domain